MKPDRAVRLKGTIYLVAGSAAALLAGSQASAQVPDEVVLNIMRECAKVDDPTARLACYDNNIRSGGFDGRGPAVPGENGTVRGGSGLREEAGPQGFGAASVRSPDRFSSSEERGLGPSEISARIAEVREREPGIYLVVLEGGAEWLFTDTAPRTFQAPRRGDAVELSRAALGSFLMTIGNQQAIRVRRIK